MYLSGQSRAITFLYAPAPPPPTVWALKPPSWALVHKTTYAPMIYTACLSITRAGGRVLDPGNREFFGPCEMVKWHPADRRVPFGAQRFYIWGKTFIHRLFGEKNLNVCALISQKNCFCLAVGKYCSKQEKCFYLYFYETNFILKTYLRTLLRWSWMDIPTR
jgi:hypothetical protein